MKGNSNYSVFLNLYSYDSINCCCFGYFWHEVKYKWLSTNINRLCGLVVRVLGYGSGGPGSIPGTTIKEKAVGLERGPLSLVSTTEELLDRKVAAPV
jgi:hypothetical protein